MSKETHQLADSEFNSARMKALRGSFFSILNPEKKDLLAFHDIKSLIKPKAEFYKGGAAGSSE